MKVTGARTALILVCLVLVLLSVIAEVEAGPVIKAKTHKDRRQKSKSTKGFSKNHKKSTHKGKSTIKDKDQDRNRDKGVMSLGKHKVDDLLNTIKGTVNQGIGTYYDVGPGSCGKTDTDDELVVAVNKAQMHNGPNPNNNKKCEKMVLIEGTKGNCKARIVDTCPKCPNGGLDMSRAVFKKVCGNLDQGKCSIKWKYM